MFLGTHGNIKNVVKAGANARNIVGQQDATLLGPTCCERLHTMLCVVATCWMKFVKLHPTTSNKSQQHATTHNMVWPTTMLRAFAPALMFEQLQKFELQEKPQVRLPSASDDLPLKRSPSLLSSKWNCRPLFEVSLSSPNQPLKAYVKDSFYDLKKL